jgi:hypothetical protein
MSAVAYRRFESLQALSEPAPVSPRHFEPIIIDFAKHRRRPSRVGAYLPWVLLMAVGFLILGFAGFLIYGERTGLLKSSLLSIARPQVHLPPGPPVALGRDTRSDNKSDNNMSLPKISYEVLDPKAVSLVSVLKRLPVGRAMETPPRIKRGSTPPTPKPEETSQDFEAAFVPEPAPLRVAKKVPPKEQEISVAVIEDETQSRVTELTDTAANDAASGKSENAIRLYTEALALDPEDKDTAYNLAALLLQKASFFDTRGLWEDALQTYQQALHIWAADDEMGRSIRARLEWVQTKKNQMMAVVEDTIETP